MTIYKDQVNGYLIVYSNEGHLFCWWHDHGKVTYGYELISKIDQYDYLGKIIYDRQNFL